MSNKNRRALARATGTLGKRQLAEDVCQVCAFIASRIIGGREQDFKLPDGTLVELGVNKRLEPPLGIRFPKSAAKRANCIVCAGSGRLQCDQCGGKGSTGVILAERPQQACLHCQGSGKMVCEKCAGFGINWIKTDFAPTCMLCSQFIMAWLKERENLTMHRTGANAASKIVLPSSEQSRRVTGSIILPR